MNQIIMNKSVAITGMGIISSIGNTVEENFQSLIAKRSGISRIKNIKTHHKNDIKVGEIRQPMRSWSMF